MTTFFQLLLPLYKFYFYLMSISKYLQLKTKVINDDPTPQCSPHLLASSASPTAIKKLPSKARQQRTTRAYPGH